MNAARMISGPVYLEMIEEIDRELTKAIEDFDWALYVETLHLADETSKLSFSQSIDSWSSCFGIERAEQEQVEQECLEQEQVELVEQEWIKQEWIKQEQNEWEQMEQEQMEQEQMEQEQMEWEWVEQEQAEQEWVEQEQVEWEQEFLFRCLKPVKAGYHCDLCCLNGTQQSLRN